LAKKKKEEKGSKGFVEQIKKLYRDQTALLPRRSSQRGWRNCRKEREKEIVHNYL